MEATANIFARRGELPSPGFRFPSSRKGVSPQSRKKEPLVGRIHFPPELSE
jgi:hypothetical protein